MPHPDLQTSTALTPRQMVGQFWQKIAAFDAEFSRPEASIAGEWLNIGVKRLVDDLVKRIVEEQDQIAVVLMKDHIEDIDLTITKDDDALDGRYYANYTGTGSIIALWDLHIWKSLQLKPMAASQDEFPKWWPSKPLEGGGCEGISLMTDFVDITDSYDEHLGRVINNSFTDLYNGPNSKVYLHKDVEEFPYTIITQSPFQAIQGRKDVEPDKNKSSFWRIDRVQLAVLKHSEMYEAIYIDIDDETNVYTALPAILHNDIIDYATDAYFEAQYYQKAGKQTAKMARQEAAPVSPQQN